MEDQRIPVVCTFEPGGTGIGDKIRRILLDARHKNLLPLTELLLYEADRAQHVEEVIRPALKQGKWVICDRFCDATVAYQGVGRGQDMEWVEKLNAWVTQGVRPDRTFLLDCPVELGLERAYSRNRGLSDLGQDRFERERLDFHAGVRQGYLELARADVDRFVIIDACQTEDRLEEEIFGHLRPYLEGSQSDIV
jgi:dTMP kinase